MILKKRIQQFLHSLQVLLMRLFYSKPDAIISFGISIGDDLLCTIVAEQLNKQGYKRVWMLTCFPELFFNSPHVHKVIKKDKNGNASPLMRKYFKRIRASIIHPWYTSYNKITDQDVIPQKHIALIMCDVAKVQYPHTIKPNIYLTEREKQKGKLYDNQICIHSTGLGARQHMHNKDWYPERFDEVVTVLKNEYTFIQIGSTSDYLLPHVVDMRGKTNIREAAGILYNSNYFIGQVGFLMHLSRSVDCKSVIIYGGRERPDQSGYEFNANLYSPVSCSPCWYWNFCPNDKMCMKEISAKDVINAIKKLSLVSSSENKIECDGIC